MSKQERPKLSLNILVFFDKKWYSIENWKGSGKLDIKHVLENSNLSIPKDNILYNEDMKKHTTFKIGGPAECFIKIKTEQELKEILVLANENNIPVTILGNGSNILVLDGGIKGITLTIQIEYIDIKQDENKYKVYVGGGYKLAKLCLLYTSRCV